MTDKELMQLALYALGLAKSSHNMMLSSDPPQSAWRYYDVDMKLQETITALDKRLAQTEQEHTGFMDSKINPMKRPWVGLTDEEVSDLWCKVSNTDFVTVDTHEFARAVDDKLRSKNT